MNSNEKFLQKTHGSISCYQVHPDKPHDGWYELHNGNWCTIIHHDESHDEYSDKLEKNPSVKRKDLAEQIGKEIAKRSIEKGVKEVTFDKGKYKYHGIVKILADAARSGGLNF